MPHRPAVESPTYRHATVADVDAVARLHADSWRRHYRGAYPDAFLDGPVFADRLAMWTAQLTPPTPDEFTIVADLDGAVVGFARTILYADPAWGALLDNLHVVHDRKGQGIGTRLVAETARTVIARAPTSGLYLKVLEQNTAAQAFYDARRGTRVATGTTQARGGEGTLTVFTYAWPDPSVLLASD